MGNKFVRAKKLTFFNNKGGVGKTTLAYNCAVEFAKKGYKTVLIDLDTQCNLTRLALGDEFYEETLFSNSYKTIYDMLSGIIAGNADVDTGIQFEPAKGFSENLFLLRGDVRIYEYENLLPLAFNMAEGGNAIGFTQTSAIQRFLDTKGMGSDSDVDIYIIDTSPNLNSLNHAIFLGTDYFVVPVMPDAFSVQGIENLGKVFTRWKDKWKDTAYAMRSDILMKNLLDGDGLFIGYILNSYNIYGQQPIKDHRGWIEQIPQRVEQHLSLKHSRNGLVAKSCEEPLASIQDFGRLPAITQHTGRAIFDITEKQIASFQVGTKENVDKAKEEFNDLSDRILSILMNY